MYPFALVVTSIIIGVCNWLLFQEFLSQDNLLAAFIITCSNAIVFVIASIATYRLIKESNQSKEKNDG